MILYNPQIIKPKSQRVIMGAKVNDILWDPNCWIQKSTKRTTSETARTLSKSGFAIWIPAIALNTEVVGVKRPSEMINEHPRKHAVRTTNETTFTTVGFCFHALLVLENRG